MIYQIYRRYYKEYSLIHHFGYYYIHKPYHYQENQGQFQFL